jgi:hypothetical protein
MEIAQIFFPPLIQINAADIGGSYVVLKRARDSRADVDDDREDHACGLGFLVGGSTKPIA